MRGLLVASLAMAVGLAPDAASADPRERAAAVREADTAVHSAELAGQRLLRILDEARLTGRPRLVACVDVKLAQVNSFGRMIQDRRERLQRAVERGDDSAAAHERLVIRNLRAQLARIEREGRTCVHPDAGQSGTTVVVTVVDADVPDEDPSLLTEDDRRRWAQP